VKLTKRGFLQSIGSVLAAGTVADKAQSAGLEKMALNAPIGWSDGGLDCNAPIMPDILVLAVVESEGARRAKEALFS